jgi:hypothetical protein
MTQIADTQLTTATPPDKTVRALQAIGVISTAIGAVVLMLEGLGRVDAISRFFSFSGILALCAALGLMVSYRNGDQRSARLLLKMYLALVPVFWSQLGAVICNAFGGDSTVVPSALRIEGAGLTTALLGGGIALLVIAPFSALVARILIPKATAWYSAMLLSLGALLCFPERSGVIAGVVLVFSSCLVFFSERVLFSKDRHFSTLEAKWARGVLISILAIMAGRGVFYGFTEPLFFSITGLMSAMLYLLVSPSSDKERSNLRLATDLFLGFGVAVLFSGLYRLLGATAAHALSYLVPAAYLMISGKSADSAQAKIAAGVLACGSILYMNDPSLVASSLALLLPACAVYLGFHTRSLCLTAIGLVTAAIGSQGLFSALMDVVYDYRWSALMLLGIALVFSAPYAERVVKQLRAKWTGGSSKPKAGEDQLVQA